MIAKNIHDQRTSEALTIKLYYTYRLIPAAFLEVEFPKLPYLILYQDKICSSADDGNTKTLSSAQGVFSDCFQVNDPDFEAGRADPL